jgi:hypothetical protein
VSLSQCRSSRGSARGSSQSRGRVGGRRAVDRQRDDVGTADDGQSNGASLLGLGDLLGCAGRIPALVLRRVRRNSSVSARTRFMCCGVVSRGRCVRGGAKGAYLIEGEHLPNHLPVVLKCHPHAVVDLRTVSLRWGRAGERALTRFCCSTARQSVCSMRVVFSDGRLVRAIRHRDLPSCPVGWRQPW